MGELVGVVGELVVGELVGVVGELVVGELVGELVGAVVGEFVQILPLFPSPRLAVSITLLATHAPHKVRSNAVAS